MSEPGRKFSVTERRSPCTDEPCKMSCPAAQRRTQPVRPLTTVENPRHRTEAFPDAAFVAGCHRGPVHEPKNNFHESDRQARNAFFVLPAKVPPRLRPRHVTERTKTNDTSPPHNSFHSVFLRQHRFSPSTSRTPDILRRSPPQTVPFPPSEKTEPSATSPMPPPDEKTGRYRSVRFPSSIRARKRAATVRMS